MKARPDAYFVAEVVELSRLGNQQLDVESEAIIRIELLDLLAQAEKLDLEPKLAHSLLEATRAFFRPEISVGVFGRSEFPLSGQFEADIAVVEVQRIAGEVSWFRMGASGNLT